MEPYGATGSPLHHREPFSSSRPREPARWGEGPGTAAGEQRGKLKPP